MIHKGHQPCGVLVFLFKILSRWPANKDSISPAARSIITKLLFFRPCDRLGAGGAKEIKQEEFFQDVQWNDLYLKPSPFIPELCFHGEDVPDRGETDFALNLASGPPRSGDEDSSDFGKFSYCDFESSLTLDDRAIIERAGSKGS